jgi:hypothetical protein
MEYRNIKKRKYISLENGIQEYKKNVEAEIKLGKMRKVHIQ